MHECQLRAGGMAAHSPCQGEDAVE